MDGIIIKPIALMKNKLPPTQKKIYQLIKKGKLMSITDMARSLGFTRQNCTEQLNKLKDKGLVVEQPRFIVKE